MKLWLIWFTVLMVVYTLVDVVARRHPLFHTVFTNVIFATTFASVFTWFDVRRKKKLKESSQRY